MKKLIPLIAFSILLLVPVSQNAFAGSLVELCNGLDDDGDGDIDEDFDLGNSCTVGIGQCERTGQKICSGDQMETICSVAPGTPIPENVPGDMICTDGIDNDCDGLTDLADFMCQAPEICDGLDNDGDSQIDEGLNCDVIGGSIIPIDSTSLLLANTQSFSWMIPVVLSILGIGLFVIRRK